MPEIYLSNTLARKKEKFIPLNPPHVGIYSCGPTVYWNQHIGHMYAYIQWDILVRFLRYVGYEVRWVMNITDVGHMTSDEDYGEDKMEKGARREKISVWELAGKYIGQFKESLKLLNITQPDVMPRATEYIENQIRLIQLIEGNGYTYQTQMGVVFDTSKFTGYANFAGLDLIKQQKRADVEEDPEKKNPWDFFLWVTGNPKHIMQWDSPWGKGFPGWHIECTAMSTKCLGNHFDIHTGGIEHIPVHHSNEIAQGYGAFGKQTANYWLHNAWLTLATGEKMSKSLGNILTIQELKEKGYDPLAFRYLVLTSHYKKGLKFSWESLAAAAEALSSLRNITLGLKESRKQRGTVSPEKLEKIKKYSESFLELLADDINAPKALAVFWEMLKSNIPSEDKYDLALSFDEVLGLKLAEVSGIKYQVSSDIEKLMEEREKLRREGKFVKADEIRRKIYDLGFKVEDTPKGSEVKLRTKNLK